MKKLNKKEKSQINVWNEINSSLVEKYLPKDSIEDLLNQTSQQLEETQQVTKEVTTLLKKADIGRTIFQEEEQKVGGEPPRAITIKRLIQEANLTKKGAATYFQNMKKKAGYVKAKA